MRRPIPLIDQSVKGYFQFAQAQKKDELVLEFLPLEKVDEHYLPEEIEEEIIFPSNLTVPLTRKVTSSFSPPSKQRSGKMPALANDAAADVFRNVQSKVNIHNKQQPPIDSLQRTNDNEIVHKKRSVVSNVNNPPEEEKPRPSLSSNNNNQSPKFITEPEKYSSEQPTGAFGTKRTITTTPSPKNGDQSDVRKSSLSSSSSSKVQSSRIAPSEGSELFPRRYGEPTKQPSSSPPPSSTINASSREIASSVKLNESKAATTTTASGSPSSHKSKVIAEDDNSRKGNSQPEQFTNNITKKMLEPSAKTFSSIQPDAKTQTEGIAQTTKKIATPADKSLNLSDTFSQSTQDNSIRLPMSRNSTMNTSFASITPSKTKIDGDDIRGSNNNNNSIIKPHGLLSSQTSASDRNHKPTITINKLDVHVVGSSNYNVQRPILNPSTESADIHSHKLDFEDHQINTEILNKSYLWKYKVRL